MEVNVTYHWTYLDYEAPAYKKSTTWGPVANISIDAKVELPFARDGHIFVNYDRIRCVIDSNDDPRDQIIRYIQHYAEVKGIEVHFDFLERWEKKPLNDSDWTDDFDF